LGEVAALWVSDVDFLGRRIELHRNAVAVGKHFEVGSLKSNKNRSVALPSFVIDAPAKTAEGKPRRPAVAVGDRRLSSAAVFDRFVAVRRGGPLQKADPTFPRVTTHALRHTAASLAISAGANPKGVQRMLGHASAALTLDVYAEL
jgi:integrase